MSNLDELQLYFKKDYVINDNIILKQPTIGEIVGFGEKKYFSIAQNLIIIPSDIKSVLFDSGIDYEKITDFELFILMSKNYTPGDTRLLLGDINLSEFETGKRKDNDETVLYNTNTGVIIDRYIYLLIVKYICTLHGFKQKIEKSANEFTKKILIDEDRENRLRNKEKEPKSILLPLISSMINSNGFKYNSKEVLNIGLYEFMDSVKRIGLIKNVDYLMNGIYAGSLDTNAIKKTELDWMKEL